MQAVEPDQPYKVSLNPRILSEYVAEFNAVMDEVTMIPQPNAFKVRCSQDSKDAKTKEEGIGAGLQTELTIDPNEFDIYHIAGDDTELNFTLRELKALLNFCDFASQNVEIHYECAGSPIVFKASTNQGLLDANFIIATHHHVQLPGSRSGSQVTGTSFMQQAAPPVRVSESPLVSQQQEVDKANHVAPKTNAKVFDEAGNTQNRYERSQASEINSRRSDMGSQMVSPATSALGSDAPSAGRTMPLVEDEESSEDEYVEGTPPPSPTQSKRGRVPSYKEMSQRVDSSQGS